MMVDDVLTLLYRRPVEIAIQVGFVKLIDLHNGWIKWMVFGDGDGTLQAHRGSYKTTCLSVAIALIMLLFPLKTVIFLRKTDDDVKEVVRQVAKILKTKTFRYLGSTLYGEQLRLVEDNAASITTSLFVSTQGASQLLGLGISASITGKHADIVITDDIVNKKDRVSKAEREATKLTYQELENVRNPGGRIINTGTPWHKDDAFTLMPEPARYDCYSTGLLSDDEIIAKRERMSASLFAANYELKHIADKDAMFGDAQFFADEKLLYGGIMHIDAAYGGEDGTAVTVLRRIGDVFYVYGRRFDMHVDDCLPDAIAIHSRFRAGTVYCEKNADKDYLAKAIRNEYKLPVSSYHESTNKYIKIATHLKGEWVNVYFLAETDPDYIAEILDYTENAAHDDAPDSLASAIRELSKPGWVA